MQTHGARALGQRRIARDQHAALARRHGLVRVETEHRRVARQRADHCAAMRARQRVGRIFDHLQTMALGDGENGRHVRTAPAKVHRNDGLGARSDVLFDLAWIDAQAVFFDVHQHRIGTEITNHLGAGREGVRGGDHLVAGADACGFKRQMQTCGRGIHRHGFKCCIAQKLRKRLLETPGLGARGEPARAQRVDDFGDLLLAHIGQGKRQQGLWFGHRRILFITRVWPRCTAHACAAAERHSAADTAQGSRGMRAGPAAARA